MADEIEFLENYKTHVASAVIMMQVQYFLLFRLTFFSTALIIDSVVLRSHDPYSEEPLQSVCSD